MHDATLPTLTGTMNPAHIAAAAYLARYQPRTRALYTTQLQIFFAWCADRGLDPIAAKRSDLELYVRHLSEQRNLKATTVNSYMAPVKGMYRMAQIDGTLPRDPAAHVLLPRVHTDQVKILGLDRMELGAFLAASRRLSPQHAALAVLLGLLGLRVSEACAVQIGDFDDVERGHRVLHVVGKGSKPATIPLTAPVQRALDGAKGDRQSGPLLTRKKDGAQLDRHNAAWMVQTIARHAGITKRISPHSLRHSFVTNALDAGVPLRDVQDAARHSDPRTTMRYDRARGNLDRHAVHILSAYVAGAA